MACGRPRITTPGDPAGLPGSRLAISPAITHGTLVFEGSEHLLTMIESFLAAPPLPWFNPHLPRRAGPTRVLRLNLDSPDRSFNPHPPRRAGATRAGRADDPSVIVSIPTRYEERVQQCAYATSPPCLAGNGAGARRTEPKIHLFFRNGLLRHNMVENACSQCCETFHGPQPPERIGGIAVGRIYAASGSAKGAAAANATSSSVNDLPAGKRRCAMSSIGMSSALDASEASSGASGRMA